MALTQLSPSIPMSTPHGIGYAFAVIDYSQEHHLLWVIAIESSGEIWCVPNPQCRVLPNYSLSLKPPATDPSQSHGNRSIPDPGNLA
jgi:hypothetical protein